MGKDKKKSDRPLPPTPAGAPAPPPDFDMVFHCQLAHGSVTKQIRDFTNVKQLYESIAAAFQMSADDILYCTLNTHNIDMSRLLGGQIGLDDFLFAHCAGAHKTLSIKKSGPALGLTISDNGNGRAFIKKIREDSIMALVKDDNGKPAVLVGDHIKSINGINLVNKRHFEVARMLKEIEVDQTFTIELVSPKTSFADIAPRGQLAQPKELKPGEARKTLRMKSNGSAVVEDEPSDAVQQIVNKIDELLEQFVGIRDQGLSTTLYDMAKHAQQADDFAGQLDQNLPDFEFTDDFVLDVFELAHPQR